ncbi:hypothetical protein ACHAXN_003731 [Cyclotella atomus]
MEVDFPSDIKTNSPTTMDLDFKMQSPAPATSFSFNSSSYAPQPKPKGILKGQKKVRFSISSTGIHANTKTPLEVHNSWYTESEVEKFKAKALKAAKGLMEESAHVAKAYIERTVSTNPHHLQGKFTGIKHVCGIEHLLCRAVCGMLLSTRNESILAVIEEQKRQRKCGHHNPQLLCQVYMEKGLFARVWRHRIAVLNSSD